MKSIKKVIFGSLSILAISFLVWTVLLLNPNLSYANQTQFNEITIYHNQELGDEVELIIDNVMSIVRSSDIYDQGLNIQFCLNDDKYFPKLHPFAKGTAYAFSNKTVMYASQPDFKNNIAQFVWGINNFEPRKYDLTALLAHEFMHNYQANYDTKYYITNTIGKINWKLEGHAEYIARKFKNDGRLLDKIEIYLFEEKRDHVGVPVIKLEDETIQNLSYLKYSLVIQYLMEVKELKFDQICNLEISLHEQYSEMIEWREIQNDR